MICCFSLLSFLHIYYYYRYLFIYLFLLVINSSWIDVFNQYQHLSYLCSRQRSIVVENNSMAAAFDWPSVLTGSGDWLAAQV